ncbi:MAG: guanylate kinase [Omnitrophica bacterium RIFCSPLOWO2_02_FULL_45_16]|nr:MAG: guanylate kinase [Omnitrophica bacterium RIFCSPHIGHO2_02_FULL_46_20]OGW99877.1 MAG: guanylate kinase [Omnitrophica bacterium RIFCSPLOWO2_02_FULL_45_16]
MTKAAAKHKGKVFVISAPSGCGKTTLCKKLLDDNLKLARSISVTTRSARKGEKKGVDYRFVSPAEFIAMIDKKEFLEYEENFGYLYGTPKKFVEDLLNSGKNVLLSIDVKGAMNVRKLYPKESVLIFILPPSIEALKKRLESRSSDAAHSILNRLKISRKEIAYKNRYDYTVVNDRLDTAYKKLKNIIISEGERYAGPADR